MIERRIDSFGVTTCEWELHDEFETICELELHYEVETIIQPSGCHAEGIYTPFQ
jgi:hypothetical protein